MNQRDEASPDRAWMALALGLVLVGSLVAAGWVLVRTLETEAEVDLGERATVVNRPDEQQFCKWMSYRTGRSIVSQLRRLPPGESSEEERNMVRLLVEQIAATAPRHLFDDVERFLDVIDRGEAMEGKQVRELSTAARRLDRWVDDNCPEPEVVGPAITATTSP